MTLKTVLLAAAAVAAMAGAARAETPAQRFGAREDVIAMRLSPDGTHVAMLRAIKGAGTALFVGDLTTGAAPRAVISSTGRPDQLRGCAWSTATRIVCTITTSMMEGADRAYYSRVISLNADGSGVKEVSAEATGMNPVRSYDGGGVIDWLDDGKGAVLMTRVLASGGAETGTILTSARHGVIVERVDTASLQRRQVEGPRPGNIGYATDGHGTVRLMWTNPTSSVGRDSDHISYFYRQKNSRDWKQLSAVKITPSGNVGFQPEAVDRDLDVVYGFDNSDGRMALYRIALDGSLRKELVLDNAGVDVDGLIRIGRARRVVGASFATDRRQAVFFDPALNALATSLRRALPGSPAIQFVDASADERTLLLHAGSDVDPGRFYLFNRDTKKLAEVMPDRPQLAGLKLAEQKPITFKAADGTTIPGYLTLPPGSDGRNLPAIVMPHGGPADRDEWGFDWLPQFFANRGFAVLQPNYRGSTGYGDKWFQKNGFQSWRTAVGDVNDAGRYLQSSGIAAPGKLAVVGWSYGGYAALQSAVLDADLFKAIVAVAPVTDLDTLRAEHRDYSDYAIVSAFIGTSAQLREGSPAQNAARIKAPVLLFHGDLDTNVGVGESRLMASRLRGAGKQVDYVEYKGLTHQLDDGDVRAEMLDKSDAFLRKALALKG